MWYGPYIVKKVFNKGVYELIEFERNVLPKPRNGLCLAFSFLCKYCAQFVISVYGSHGDDNIF